METVIYTVVKGTNRRGGKKHRKYGRTARPRQHRAGQHCSVKGCSRLAGSRVYNDALGCYVARDVAIRVIPISARAAEPIR